LGPFIHVFDTHAHTRFHVLWVLSDFLNCILSPYTKSPPSHKTFCIFIFSRLWNGFLMGSNKNPHKDFGYWNFFCGDILSP